MEINLLELGTEAFDYFPAEFLAEETATQGINEAYQQHLATLHTSNVWDTSLVLPGIKVKTREGFTGVTTNYHLTENGKVNGGIEVVLDEGKVEYYYPNQLTRLYQELTINVHPR